MTTQGWLKLGVKLAVSVATLWLVLQHTDSRELLSLLKHAEAGWLAVAVLLFTLSKVASAERLRMLFQPIGFFLGRWSHLKLYWLGMYYNLFLPGGIGGDGYKIILLGRLTGLPYRSLLFATLLDRVIGVLALGYMLLALFGAAPQDSVPIWFCWLAILLIHAAGHWLLRRHAPAYAPAFNKAALQSLWVQSLQVLQVLCLLRAVDATGPIELYALVFLISSVVATLPLTIGGLGARQLTFFFGAQWLGLSVETAVAVSLLFDLITMAVSFIGIYYSFQSARLRSDLVS